MLKRLRALDIYTQRTATHAKVNFSSRRSTNYSACLGNEYPNVNRQRESTSRRRDESATLSSIFGFLRYKAVPHSAVVIYHNEIGISVQPGVTTNGESSARNDAGAAIIHRCNNIDSTAWRCSGWLNNNYARFAGAMREETFVRHIQCANVYKSRIKGRAHMATAR